MENSMRTVSMKSAGDYVKWMVIYGFLKRRLHHKSRTYFFDKGGAEGVGTIKGVGQPQGIPKLHMSGRDEGNFTATIRTNPYIYYDYD
jgi:hypothetical protein